MAYGAELCGSERTQDSTEDLLQFCFRVKPPVTTDMTTTPTPQFLDRVQCRGISRQQLNGDVVGNTQVIGDVPASPHLRHGGNEHDAGGRIGSGSSSVNAQ
jgi:hypothetical protein